MRANRSHLVPVAACAQSRISGEQSRIGPHDCLSHSLSLPRARTARLVCRCCAQDTRPTLIGFICGMDVQHEGAVLVEFHASSYACRTGAGEASLHVKRAPPLLTDALKRGLCMLSAPVLAASHQRGDQSRRPWKRRDPQHPQGPGRRLSVLTLRAVGAFGGVVSAAGIAAYRLSCDESSASKDHDGDTEDERRARHQVGGGGGRERSDDCEGR